jgi:hypothetical protein
MDELQKHVASLGEALQISRRESEEARQRQGAATKFVEISIKDIAALVEALEGCRRGAEEAAKREEEATKLLKEREEEDLKVKALPSYTSVKRDLI